MANRFYGIKDKSDAIELTESDLYDVTTDELQEPGTTQARIDQIMAGLDSANGWLIQFDSGEKVLSAAVVFNKQANFTTYTPPPDSGGGSLLCRRRGRQGIQSRLPDSLCRTQF